MRKMKIEIVILFLIVVPTIDYARADLCCRGVRKNGPQGWKSYCEDGSVTRDSPFDCCGVGACKESCCNCDGGCRKKNS